MAHVTEVMTMGLLERKPNPKPSRVILRSKNFPLLVKCFVFYEGHNQSASPHHCALHVCSHPKRYHCRLYL